MGAVQLAIYDTERCMFWGGADGRRDSKAAGANVGAIPMPADQQACARLESGAGSIVPN